jgi:hypothetical protein
MSPFQTKAQLSYAVPLRRLGTAYRSKQTIDIRFELRKKTGDTANVFGTPRFFNFAGPLQCLWNIQITKFPPQGVGGCLYCFRLPLLDCNKQGCQVFRSLVEKDVDDLPKKRFISTELLQGLRHIPRGFAFFLHLSFVFIDARIVAAFR